MSGEVGELHEASHSSDMVSRICSSVCIERSLRFGGSSLVLLFIVEVYVLDIVSRRWEGLKVP